MQNKILKKERMTAFLDHLADKHNLIAPVSEDKNFTIFKRVFCASEVDLSFSNSILPPKNHFFPASEKIFSFSATDGNISIEESPQQPETSVIFGIRPCDIKGLSLLDPVFYGAFPDTYYCSKRENTLLIGLSCREVLPTCFCKAFGTDPTDGQGADLMFTDLGSYYLVEILTDNGINLFKTITDFFTEETPGAVLEKGLLKDKLAADFIRNPDLSGVKQILDKLFEHPYWHELSAKCIGCGICTFICPTCHCFNMIDTSQPDASGSRYRCHDSCMFPGFTKMAGGHNPRPTKVERIRNRFMHKLKYHLDRYNLEGCTGCGRCIAKCPVNIDISQIITSIKEVVKDD